MLIYAKNSRVGKFRNVVLDDEIAKTFDKEDRLGKYRIEGFINARSGLLEKIDQIIGTQYMLVKI